MAMEWKPRGSEKEPYKARQISHESNTSIEYGEKTWTTAQTVRDLMQNHLDAETEKYYRNISSIILDQNQLKGLLEKDNNGLKKEINDFLYSVYMFANHVEDMTPETRTESEAHLMLQAEKFPVNEGVKKDGKLDPSLFLEQARQLSEHIPLVSYEVIDETTGESMGFIPYETLRDEEMYQEKSGGEYRYRIEGMKIIDRGSGYDSQLSSLYLSSKTEKKHTRGKFGEGAKMSELHLLRHGAKMKMRSQYTLESENETKNRYWQVRPKVKDERLVSEGVEIEKNGSIETGSMIQISLKDADETFKKEFLDNSDPRLGGLAKNIAEYSFHDFKYPMPITEKALAGVNMGGNGKEQFVQGLRVELAAESFGYREPWFSYDIWDSSIIGGRDRNEIKADIEKKIQTFWRENDNPDILKRLVSIAVNDRSRNEIHSSLELNFLDEILRKDISSEEIETMAEQTKAGKQERQQKVIDATFIDELSLEKGLKTLILSQRDSADDGLRKEYWYAQNNGYEIKIIANNISVFAVDDFTKRLGTDYDVHSWISIRNMMNSGKGENKPEKKKFVEGEREIAIRASFESAADSVNAFMKSAGLSERKFRLAFKEPKEIDFSDSYDDDSDYDKEYREREYGDEEEPEDPIIISWNGSHILIDPTEIHNPLHGDPLSTQRQIEAYLLSAFDMNDRLADSERLMEELGDEPWGMDDEMSGFQEGYPGDEEGGLKGSQRLLDKLITKLMPDDSAILAAIPESFDHAKNPEAIMRLVDSLIGKKEGKTLEERRNIYEKYKKALNVNLKFAEAKKILEESGKGYELMYTRDILESRVFISDKGLSYYDEKLKTWDRFDLSEAPVADVWNGRNVYKLPNGRFFVPAPMEPGAVLAQGEGKERKYIFNEGDDFLNIGGSEAKYHNPHYGDISVHPSGFVISEKKGDHRRLSDKDYIQKQLDGHKYYPSGVAEKRSIRIVEGVAATSIPIEYGKDEWDNPVRVFQDIVQNHVDASAGKVKLSYEIQRGGDRIWIEENEMKAEDMIIGLKVKDDGEGYSPSEIATMGASSKRSPLFAGKYGEGQKMVAAAALRNGLELSYASGVMEDGGVKTWSAQAIKETREVVLDGKKVEKNLVAFDVKAEESRINPGSETAIRISAGILPEQKGEWDKWVNIIDPRNKDKFGNSGMGRFVRQLREPRGGREYKIGSVTLLLDEPGAVYENGLRINPDAESKRDMSFGYDVPEIVTTRERNSFNPNRLKEYMKHSISQIMDPIIIREILEKMVKDKGRTPDLNIGYIVHTAQNPSPVWAEIVKELWPDHFVYSSERIQKEIDGPEWPPMSKSEQDRVAEAAEEARFIKTNLVHLDKKRILDVSDKNYHGFARMMPSAEDAIKRLKTQTLPISPDTREKLSSIVAESGKIFGDILDNLKMRLTPDQLKRHPLAGAYQVEERIKKWSNKKGIESDEHGVAVAPITSAFHGKADKGVVFNEHLLMGEIKRDLAHVSLHEMAHFVSREADYTEDFVTVLYELAKHLASKQNQS